MKRPWWKMLDILMLMNAGVVDLMTENPLIQYNSDGDCRCHARKYC